MPLGCIFYYVTSILHKLKSMLKIKFFKFTVREQVFECAGIWRQRGCSQTPGQGLCFSPLGEEVSLLGRVWGKKQAHWLYANSPL